MPIILPTKSFKTEYQPDGKTIFALSYRITNSKRVRDMSSEEARQMLNMILRFENSLMSIKMELLQKAKL